MTPSNPYNAAPVPVSGAGGRYELLLELASGGMATVYVGRQRGAGGFERLVAIKRMHKHLAESPDVVASFMDEARVASTIRHPNVVSVHDVYEHEGELFLVMDFVDGVSVAQLFKAALQNDVMIPRAAAIRILAQALHGLHAAHEQRDLSGNALGIVHRDATPHNLLLGEDGSVRIADFGVAKAHERSVHTETGVAKGKIAYMSPEQARAQHVDRRTDVFAMGITAIEILSGRRMFEGHTNVQILVAVSTGNMPKLSELNLILPPELENIIVKAIAHDPAARWQTADDFASALEHFASTSGATEGQRELSRTVKTLFSETLEKRRQRLRQVLASGVTVPASSVPLENAATVAHDLGRATGTVQGITGTVVPYVPEKKGLGPGMMLAAVGVGLFVSVVGGGYWLFVRERGTQKATTTTARSVESVVSSTTLAPANPCPDGMALIEGGKFFMGSDEPTAMEAERPSSQVTLSSFCVGTTEVTAADYRRCSDVGECRRPTDAVDWPGISPKEREVYVKECTGMAEGKALHPINCIDWEMASQYCASKKQRLPTEAEWEYATRGNDGRLYPWGDAMPDATRLNACGSECAAWATKAGIEIMSDPNAKDDYLTTAPVKSFPAGRSPYGAFDLAGNVWEWTGTWYAPHTKDAKTDPVGAAKGEKRVLRGGGWNGGDANWLRPSFRFAQVPSVRSPAIGFRCALVVKR
jgi:formylglycine-generating enzyme required for sulfatase activity/serine/threonine protein kinase